MLTQACKTPDMPSLLEVTLPDEANVLLMHAKVQAPEGTLYAKGIFTLAIELTSDYPHKAPKISFLSKMYHPSVAKDGKLCEKLVEDWAPTSTVKEALEKVIGLFGSVTGHEVLNEDAAKQYHESPDAFKRAVETLVKAAK